MARTTAHAASNSDAQTAAANQHQGSGASGSSGLGTPIQWRRQRWRRLLHAKSGGWRPVGFFGDSIYALRPWSRGTPRSVRLLVEHLREELRDRPCRPPPERRQLSA